MRSFGIERVDAVALTIGKAEGEVKMYLVFTVVKACVISEMVLVGEERAGRPPARMMPGILQSDVLSQKPARHLRAAIFS